MVDNLCRMHAAAAPAAAPPVVSPVGYRSADPDEMDARLERVKAAAERMSKPRQIDILRILNNSTTAKINENRSGIYVNMSFLSEDTVRELERYIDGL